MRILDKIRLYLSIRYIKKSKKHTQEEKREQLINIKKLFNEKNYEKRMSMLHDMTCDYLDKAFVKNNQCGFIDDLCVTRREIIRKGIKKDTYIDGCCHGYKEGKTCHYLGHKGCTIRNVACKLYTCPFIRRRGISYNLDRIYCTKYTLNGRQKLYLMTTFFVPKEEVLPGLIKRKRYV